MLARENAKPARSTASGWLKRARDDDEGIAIITVLGIEVVLTLIVLTLVQIGTSQFKQSARFEDGTKSQAAAEAGLNVYLAKLIQQNNFDTSFMMAGEATRVNATGWSNPETTPPPVDCDFVHADPEDYPDAVTSTDPLANLASYDFWYHPCGFDAWAEVDADADPSLDQYEYSVAVYPRDTIENSLRIIAAGRKKRTDPDFDGGTLRIVELEVKPSSFSKYQMISRNDIVVRPETTTEGEIYSEGEVRHFGTVRNRVIGKSGVLGCDALVAGSCEGTWVPNTPAQLHPDCAPNRAAYFAAGEVNNCHEISRAGREPEFGNIEDAIDAVENKVQGGGGLELPAPGPGWHAWMVKLSGGMITAQRCTWQTGTIPPREGVRGPVLGDSPDPNALEDTLQCQGSIAESVAIGNPTFVYSDYPIAIGGGHPDSDHDGAPDSFVNNITGRVTIVSAKDIYVGGHVYYGSDLNETDDDFTENVLGLIANGEVILPAWAPSDMHVTAAAIAYLGTVHDSDRVAWSEQTGPCESDVTVPVYEPDVWCVKGDLTWAGSWLSGSTQATANVIMFASRTWDFYEQLTSLAPPLWPNATNDFDIVHWLERHTDFDLCDDQSITCT